MPSELKAIKDIFSDLKIDESLANSKIKNASLYKKKNELVITIITDSRFNLVSIYKFENYLKNRFKVLEAKIIIENRKELNIISEWENIISYIGVKYPITRTILINCKPNIEKNNIKVELQVKGKEFLEASGFKEIIENTILNFYNKKYKVEYFEKLNQELIKKYEETARRTEKMAIELAEQEIVSETKQETKQNKEEVKEEIKEQKQEINHEEEQTPLIIGRSLQIKGDLVKVEDITVDTGKVVLDGEIINTDTRELKSRKDTFNV